MDNSIFNRAMSRISGGTSQHIERGKSLFSSAVSRTATGVGTGVGIAQTGIGRVQEALSPIRRPIQKIGEFMLPIEQANEKGQEKYLQLKELGLPQQEIENEVRKTINQEYLRWGTMPAKGELSIEDGVVDYKPEQVFDPTFGIGGMRRVFTGLSGGVMKKVAQATTRRGVEKAVSRDLVGVSKSLKDRIVKELLPTKKATDVVRVMEKYNARIDRDLSKTFKAPEKISTHYEKTKGRLGANLDNFEPYKKINLEDQAVRSARLAAEDLTKARRAAMGIEVAPEGLMQESLMATVSEAYRAAGQMDKARYFSRRFSSKLTEAAQALNIGKMDIASSGESFLEGIIMRERIANLGRDITDLSQTSIKKGIARLKAESQNQAQEINKVINNRGIDDLVSRVKLSTEQRSKLLNILSEKKTISNIADMGVSERLKLLNQHFDARTSRVINAKLETDIMRRQKESIGLWIKKNIPEDRLVSAESRVGIIDDIGSLNKNGLEAMMEDLTLSRWKVDLLPKESETLGKLSREVAKTRDTMGDVMIHTNEQAIDAYLTKKGELERFYKKLNPDGIMEVFAEGARGSMLMAVRSAVNSLMFQVAPGILTSITKRIASWSMLPGDYKTMDKIIARLSGAGELPLQNTRFWREQLKFGFRMYRKHGVDLSRMTTLQDGFTMFGEQVVMPHGKSFGESRGVAEKAGAFVRGHARLMQPGVKYAAGGTDAIFATAHRAGTTQFLARQQAKLEIRAGQLSPERLAEREMQLIREAYSLTPQSPTAIYIKDQAIKDAHRANWTSNEWYGRQAMKIRDAIPFKLGKILSPFVKIPANVIGAGFEAATGVGMIRGLDTIRTGLKLPTGAERNSQIADGIQKMISSGGFHASGLLIAALLDVDDYIGAYDFKKRSENNLTTTRGAGANYIRVGGDWISLRWFGPIGPVVAGYMEARQSRAMGESAVIGYARGQVFGLLEMPVVKESAGLVNSIRRAGEQKEMNKFVESLGLDTESVRKWIEPRTLTSFFAYDVQGLLDETKYDSFGRPMPERSLKNFITGANIKEDTSNILTEEFERLRLAGSMPTLADPSGRHIDFIKSFAEMYDDTIYTDFINERKQRYAIESLRETLSEEYKSLTPEEQKKRIDDIRRREIFVPAEDFANKLRDFIQRQ